MREEGAWVFVCDRSCLLCVNVVRACGYVYILRQSAETLSRRLCVCQSQSLNWICQFSGCPILEGRGGALGVVALRPQQRGGDERPSLGGGRSASRPRSRLGELCTPHNSTESFFCISNLGARESCSCDGGRVMSERVKAWGA